VTLHFRLIYNSRIYWSIFIIFEPLEAGMNISRSNVRILFTQWLNDVIAVKHRIMKVYLLQRRL